MSDEPVTAARPTTLHPFKSSVQSDTKKHQLQRVVASNASDREHPPVVPVSGQSLSGRARCEAFVLPGPDSEAQMPTLVSKRRRDQRNFRLREKARDARLAADGVQIRVTEIASDSRVAGTDAHCPLLAPPYAEALATNRDVCDPSGGSQQASGVHLLFPTQANRRAFNLHRLLLS